LKLNSLVPLQALQEAIAQIGLCSKFEALLLRKKPFSNGDSSELHAEKVSFPGDMGHLFLFLLDVQPKI
jgi:hypothetical protein